MVFLAITPAGLHHAITLAKASSFAIWCGADAITESEYEKLRGLNISRFTYALAGESHDVIERALETIAEHHPGSTIWVEHGSAL